MTDQNLEMEPKDYFEDLKSRLHQTEIDQLESNMAFIATEIQKAKDLGQKNLLHKSAYMWQILEREMVLHAKGIRDFVYRDDVVKFIDHVKPKNSVKIVELANFPRSIPAENAKDIKAARDLGIFDLLIVVYTDLVDEETHTPEQKAFVARNRDPIVFGMFLNDKIQLHHDRMYFITDWEDEFCDLTFSKMIDRLGHMGIKNARKTIEPSTDNINALVTEAIKDVEEIADLDMYRPHHPEKTSFISKILKLFK